MFHQNILEILLSILFNNHKNIPVLFDGPIRSDEQDRVIRPILGKFVVIELELDKKYCY